MENAIGELASERAGGVCCYYPGTLPAAIPQESNVICPRTLDHRAFRWVQHYRVYVPRAEKISPLRALRLLKV
jgi:hypothetical protein